MKTINVDTFVFGGKFDEEFGYWTQKFFDQVIADNVKLLKSDVVDDELTGAPEFVHKFQTLEIRNPREAFDYEDNN